MRWAAAAVMILLVGCSGGRSPVAAVHSPSSTPATAVTPAGSPGSPATWSPPPPRQYPASSGGIVEYPIPNPPRFPPECGPACQASIGDLALGPDGNMWFEDNARKVIGRITPTGEVKQFSVAYELTGGANTIAAGPDGNIWVVASGGGGGNPDWILRVTPSGEITRLSAGERPAGEGQFGTGPESITLGPDGNLWFDEFWTNRIGRLTASGSLTEFAIPTPDSGPRGITSGPDGNIWFAESGRARPAIARVTPQGVITEFPLAEGPSDLSPYSLIAGPDGNLWFADSSGVARISSTGQVVRVPLPQGSAPDYLVSAPDGNIWFGDRQRNVIVRLGVTGAVREFPLPHRGSWPGALAVGADGRIWFAEANLPAIASIGVKVPEVLMSRRPLGFVETSTKTLSIRNSGDATLAISGVRISGVDATRFAIGADSCSAAKIAPDAACSIDVRFAAGGPNGIESAVLEMTDNATGSPQRLSLFAQAPPCELPVVVTAAGAAQGSGERLDVVSAQVLYDPAGTIPGQTPGYYDRPYSRWLPAGPNAISPDGRRYAYFPPAQGRRSAIHVVDLSTGSDRSLTIPSDFWSIVAFTGDGIYLHVAYEGLGPGIKLLNPDTGALKTVFADTTVESIDGSAAWVTTWNAADKLPDPSAMGGGSNQVMNRDLATGKTTTWLYRPGTNVYVTGLFHGAPIVSVYDGVGTTIWLVTAPNQAQRLAFPFDSVASPSAGGFTGDRMGLWVGSLDGVYLWTPRTGSVLITDTAATPAGTCA